MDGERRGELDRGAWDGELSVGHRGMGSPKSCQPAAEIVV